MQTANGTCTPMVIEELPAEIPDAMPAEIVGEPEELRSTSTVFAVRGGGDPPPGRSRPTSGIACFAHEAENPGFAENEFFL